MQPSVLVTGGAGFIGGHVIAALAAAGRHCVCIDNYSNSSPEAVARVERLAPGAITAYEADIRDLARLREVFAKHPLDAVIHMAGLKAVGESVEFPERYHENNVGGTRTLLQALQETGARKFVFSSSATVYGMATRMPLDESAPTNPMSPYGENKLDIEVILKDLARADPSWRVCNLRYFNPVGAHPSGTIGENPNGTPNNLMPYVCQVAAGWRERLSVWGNDYATVDGTGVRDFIHVMDLAEGHVAALEALDSAPGGTTLTVNLGTGRGYSVLELVRTFERVNALQVPWAFGPRREGDVPVCYADASFAQERLGWKAKRGIEDMCRDAWRWQRNLPRP
jgi:UDP-glucose 4-epimerase